MDLYQLRNFIDEKRREFEGAIKKQAADITLSDIIKTVDFDPQYFVNRNWKSGQSLKLSVNNWYFEATVGPESLILKRDSIELKRFEGNEVKAYYENLSAQIIKREEEELENLPF